jgi:lipopolysaccharide biosynthesis regulator YciM
VTLTVAATGAIHDDVSVSRVLRIGLAGLALVLCAWFALGWVQARDAGRADALLSASSSLSQARAAQIRSLLSSAGTLNPDRTVDLLRARLAQQQHRYGAAVRILESVTRAEPQNVLAWSQLGFTAGGAGHIYLSEHAAQEVGRLVPRISAH